ncbi:MAG: coenzyme F420-0:L-glutamate ligase, partial [Clostridia bacterium]
MKNIGVISRGIKTPIIKTGDNLPKIVVDSLISASVEGQFSFNDRDVVGLTESIVARVQGNYATLAQISTDEIGRASWRGIVFQLV